MRLRTSLILLLIAVLLTGLSVVLDWQEAQARQRPLSERRLISVPLKQVTTFSLYKAGIPVAEFTRDPQGRWQVNLVQQSIKDAAEPSVIQQLSAMVELCFRDPVGNMDLSAAGLDPDQATQLTVRTEDGDQTLRLGRVSPDGKTRYAARLADPKAVHAVRADLTRVLDQPVQSYRTMSLFDLRRDAPEQIVLHPGGPDNAAQRLVLARAPEGWFLVYPVRWPAAPTMMTRLLRLCQMARAEAVVTEGAAELRQKHLGPEAPRIIVQTGKITQVLRLHAQKDGHILALRVGREPVYRVDRSLYQELAHAANSKPQHAWVDRYRQRTLDLLHGCSPATVYIRANSGCLTLTRTQDGWAASGARTFPVEKAAAELLVQALHTLVIQRFVSEIPDHDRYGLNHPLLRFDCMDAGGARLGGVSLSAAQPGGQAFAAIDGRPQVLEIHPELVKILAQPFVRYRTRLVNEFDLDQAWEISIRRQGNTRVYRRVGRGYWQLLKPKTRLLEEDSPKLTILLAHLFRLHCLGYEAENVTDLARFRLDQGEIRVIVTVRPPGAKPEAARVALDLLIGAPVKIGTGAKPRNAAALPRFARLRNEKTVFVLDANIVKTIDRDFH